MLRKFPVILLICILCNHTKLVIGSDKKPKVGLVLSGGGAKGLAHIGVLKVLEEAGIKIDMVGGTSMGSIVSGLYAIGYSAAEIEKITLEQDWFYLLFDQLNRNILSVTEKEEYDKYIISFPFENLRVKLPAGLGAGQNVSMLLSRLSIPVADINDFSELPRPFLCIGTDIVTGQEVIINKGYLPDAIRASMAIPTIFTPVEINDHLLVDGGLVNNFPVDRVKEMGADIIIGVNLGLKNYTKEELKNLAAVLEQSLFFQAKERNKSNQALCNILIEPEVHTATAGSFSEVDSLIALGERAARKLFPQLKKLADSLKQIQEQTEIAKVKPVDSVNIQSLTYEGLNRVSENFLKGKLRLTVPGKIAVSDLEDAIERAYGTNFFTKINYKIENHENHYSRLVLRVEENTADLLRLGARYDSQFKTQLLLNATFRNKFVKGSRLTVDLQLGEFPRLTTEYKIHTGWKPREKPILFKNKKLGLLPDFGFRFDARAFEVYNYEDGERLATLDYTYMNFNLFASTNISNSMYFEFGTAIEITEVLPQTAVDSFIISNEFAALYGSFKIDTRNKRAFYNSGMLMKAHFSSIHDMQLNTYKYKPVHRWYVLAEKALSITKNISLLPGIQTGMSYGDSIPVEYNFYLGGSYHFGNSPDGVFQFHGLNFMEESNSAALVASLKLQINFAPNHFISIDGNLGKTSEYWEKIFFSTRDLLSGYGLRYGYDSFIGPVEIGVYNAGHRQSQWTGYLNIGYYF